MKQRILTAAVAVLCTLTLFVAGIAPVQAYASPNNEGEAVVYAEEVRIYYRVSNGVQEMRLWSLTYQQWITDWTPVPDGWSVPGN